MSSLHEPTPVTPEEAREAAEAATALEKFLKRVNAKRKVRLSPEGVTQDFEVTLPGAALHLLVEILEQMAQGNAVTLVPVHMELTTQQAADLLNVSRPYLIKLLEEGKIPFSRVGNRRKVRFNDLMAYKHADDERRREAAKALSQEAQEIGLDY